MSLAYNPQTDRLEGGTLTGDFHGRPVIQEMLSLRRAKALFEAGKELKQHYDALAPAAWASERPFSEALAVTQLESFPVMYQGVQHNIPIDELFDHPALVDAPPEYRDLCQMLWIVPSVQSLADSRARVGPRSFARQMFRTLGCAHVRARMTFTRRTGTCLGPGQVTPGGEVIDVYYLTRFSESKSRFAEFRKADIAQGLLIAVNTALAVGSEVADTLEQARRAYREAAGLDASGEGGEPWAAVDSDDPKGSIESLVQHLTGY